MNLEDKIKIALEQGKVEGAKKLASELLKQEHKAEWDKAKREEYDGLFPAYREPNDSEIQEQQEYYLQNASNEVLLREDVDFSEFIYSQVPIDYSEYENYVTYEEWINETVVVSEEVEEVSHIEVVDGFESKVIDVEYQAEVTELVRPYTPLEITDEMIEVKLLLFGYDYKAKRKAEYPSIETYIDGIVKGDEEQVQNYINECLAVKSKYPKPEES